MKLTIENLSKSYHQNQVLHNVNLQLESGNIYCLMGPSGSGKTTLLRIILGLEHSDSGTVLATKENTAKIKWTAVFQDNCLCEVFSPIENIRMVMGSQVPIPYIQEQLSCILPAECLSRPVFTLSGGMKRRVAICRAVLAPSHGIIMDEPFTGLDEETKQTVIRFIKEKTAGKLLIISTHQEEDLELLGGNLIKIPTAL